MAIYENDGHYSLELVNDGHGWCGTFGGIIRFAAADILTDGEPFGPVEITYEHDGATTTVTGVLTDSTDTDLYIDEYPEGFTSSRNAAAVVETESTGVPIGARASTRIEIDSVTRFCA